MILKFTEKINESIEKRKQKQEKNLAYKREEIRDEIIKYYEAKQATDGSVDIPSFMLADMTMAEICKTKEDINYLYRKLCEYKKNQKEGM